MPLRLLTIIRIFGIRVHGYEGGGPFPVSGLGVSGLSVPDLETWLELSQTL